QNKLQAYSLLLSKGLIRIGLPIPANTEFQVSVVNDPYNCNTNPTTGLLSPTSGIVSIYRRPLPSTNLGFLSAVMWAGREPSQPAGGRNTRSRTSECVAICRAAATNCKFRKWPVYSPTHG